MRICMAVMRDIGNLLGILIKIKLGLIDIGTIFVEYAGMTHKEKITKEFLTELMDKALSPYIDPHTTEEEYNKLKRAAKKVLNKVYDSGYEKSQEEFKIKRDRFFYKTGF